MEKVLSLQINQFKTLFCTKDHCVIYISESTRIKIIEELPLCPQTDGNN